MTRKRIKSIVLSITSHNLFKNSALVFAGSTAANFSGWLYHLFVGRILGPEKYAELSALFAIFYILNVITGVVQVSLMKFFSVLKARNDYGQANALFWKATKRVAIAEVIGMLVLYPLTPILSGYLHIRSYGYFLLVYIIFATSTITVAGGAALQGFQRFKPLTVLSNIGMLLRLITGIVGAFFGVGWTMIANIASNIGTYSFYFLSLRFLFDHKAKPITITRKQAIGYGIPVLLTTLGTTVLNSQDVLLVKHYFTSFDAGIYASLSVLGKIIFYASSAVGFVLFPLVAERKELGSDFRRSVFLGLAAVGAMSFAITIVYFLFPSVIVLPLGPAFGGASPYLGWFGIFVTFYTMATLLIQTLLAMGATKIWLITMTAALMQYLLISLYHGTLYEVTYVNTLVAFILFGSLFIYYRYATKSS
ncbi:hypothetical protein HY087_02985 [Candidatus Gottesmanbacteria bacterium]|nr:hypothetical protein [Candidatus Gottesmanbacteria bacterium]